MRIDDIDTLLYQMKIIQNVAEEFSIREIIFYGSRVLGRQTEASDYDLSCYSKSSVKLIKKYKHVYPTDFTVEQIFKASLEEAGRELAYLLNADINLTSEDTLEELYDSIRKYHVPLIVDGQRLTEEELKTSIFELRPKDIPDQKVRKQQQHEFYSLTHIIALSNIVRFIEDFATAKDFVNPKSIYRIAMRNEILNSIARFSLSVEKAPLSLLDSSALDLKSLFIIASLVRSKQMNSRNFNTLELGWSVCGNVDLSREELKIFFDFF